MYKANYHVELKNVITYSIRNFSWGSIRDIALLSTSLLRAAKSFWNIANYTSITNNFIFPGQLHHTVQRGSFLIFQWFYTARFKKSGKSKPQQVLLSADNFIFDSFISSKLLSSLIYPVVYTALDNSKKLTLK